MIAIPVGLMEELSVRFLNRDPYLYRDLTERSRHKGKQTWTCRHCTEHYSKYEMLMTREIILYFTACDNCGTVNALGTKVVVLSKKEVKL
jgi:transcription elongation factor Elf1